MIERESHGGREFHDRHLGATEGGNSPRGDTSGQVIGRGAESNRRSLTREERGRLSLNNPAYVPSERTRLMDRAVLALAKLTLEDADQVTDIRHRLSITGPPDVIARIAEDNLARSEERFRRYQAENPAGCDQANANEVELTPVRSVFQPEALSLANVEHAFAYHPWTKQQVADGDIVRSTLVTAAKAILRYVPEGPSRTRALNMLVDARMISNAAITFQGRF